MFVMGHNPAGPTVFNVTSTSIVVKLQNKSTACGGQRSVAAAFIKFEVEKSMSKDF